MHKHPVPCSQLRNTSPPTSTSAHTTLACFSHRCEFVTTTFRAFQQIDRANLMRPVARSLTKTKKQSANMRTVTQATASLGKLRRLAQRGTLVLPWRSGSWSPGPPAFASSCQSSIRGLRQPPGSFHACSCRRAPESLSLLLLKQANET